MSRMTAVECPGCPPLRALTTDVLGLVKVVEAHGKSGILKVVETWGQPDASLRILAASYADKKTDPVFFTSYESLLPCDSPRGTIDSSKEEEPFYSTNLFTIRLAVARNNGLVEFLDPLNGESLGITKISQLRSLDSSHCDDQVAALHLLKTNGIDSRLAVLLACLENGNACMRSIPIRDKQQDLNVGSPMTWSVCSAGKILCSSVDKSGNFALFGGKGVELRMWDLESCNKIWTAKPPPSNTLGIFSPTNFTTTTFLSKDDHRKIVAGTDNHQVRLYDTSAQRRPVISVNFRESPIKAVCEDLDGYTVNVGNGSGDLALFDMRTGKLLGGFIGKCSGSIRSIARHPEFPIIASCGLDRYLRVWDAKTRQLLSAVFLKQHLTNVVIDSHFSYEDPKQLDPSQDMPMEIVQRSEGNNCGQQGDSEVVNDSESVDDVELITPVSSKASKTKRSSKIITGNEELPASSDSKVSKTKKSREIKKQKVNASNLSDEELIDTYALDHAKSENIGKLSHVKRKKSSGEHSKQHKQKKSIKGLP